MDLKLMQEFIEEASDLLDLTDAQLVELEKKPEDATLLNAVFRGYHTIKGGAGFLELHGLIHVCNALESLFDRLRAAPHLKLSRAQMNAALEASNAIRSTLSHYRKNPMYDYQPEPSLMTNLALPSNTPTYSVLHAPTEASEPLLPSGHGLSAHPTTGMDSSAYEKETHIKVETTRLDSVLTLASELGLAKNRMGAAKTRISARDLSDESFSELERSYNDLERLTAALQNSVMLTRMQPIGRLFSKYPRLVRDLARNLNKTAEISITGHDTEVDKGMIEDIADPLIHLIRNAVDHGIEAPEVRVAQGKSAIGNIELKAQQEGDRIVITVSDDGRGMNPASLRAQARAKKMMPLSEIDALTDEQALELIFLPGFSTAESVTDVSGRGVGMDVVKTNISKLGGEILIQSQDGIGSSIEIRIPLTLAILPALLLMAGNQPLALPLASVQEIITLSEHETQVVGGHPVINLRGDILRALDLSKLLGWGDSLDTPVAAVVDLGNKKAALLAQSFIGRDEVMVKPLDGVKPRGVSGVVVDANGEIVLILDLKELLSTDALARLDV